MIALSAGHHPNDPGAVYGDYKEHDVAMEWVDIIAHQLALYEPMKTIPTGPLAVWDHNKLIGGKVFWINNNGPFDLAAEIHFNSDESKKQHGSETLYCPGSLRGGLAARLVQDAIGYMMPPNRGIKEGWYRQDKPGHIDYPGDVDGDETVDFILKATHSPTIIIEPEFIYNRTAIEDHRDAVCEVIARALHAAANEIRKQGG